MLASEGNGVSHFIGRRLGGPPCGDYESCQIVKRSSKCSSRATAGIRRCAVLAATPHFANTIAWKARKARVLMDAPPPQEDVRPFVRIARHLFKHGFSVPNILAEDAEQAFCCSKILRRHLHAPARTRPR